MLSNPELKRNFWLDFSLHRILVTPLVIALIVYTFYLSSSQQTAATMAFTIACLFIFIYGTKKASETVIDEINNSTWDFQRQSAISPLAMTFGKLIGSTLYSWYGAIIAIILYSIFHNNTTSVTNFLGFEQSELPLPTQIFVLVIGGLFSQALTLLLSLTSLEQIRREKTVKSFRYFLIGTLVGIFFTHFCFNALKFKTATASWYNYTLQLGPLMTVILLLFLSWTLVGLYRAFCRELQYQHLPWIWAAFNLFCIIFFAGFTVINRLEFAPTFKVLEKLLTHASDFTAFLIAYTLTYIALFADILSSVRYHKIVLRFKAGFIHEALQQLPWWVISFIFTVITAIIAAIHLPPLEDIHVSPAIFVLTSTLLLCRDILLFHYFSFGTNIKKALTSIVMYLFILYLLIPTLLSALHLNRLIVMFLPSTGNNVGLAIIAIVVQILGLGVMCYKRYRFSYNSNKALNPSYTPP